MNNFAFKLYGVPISVHTRKVILAARLKALPFEVVPVVPIDPSSLPPDWSTTSPTGLIPVIDDAGFTLSDSTAIVLYLERKQPEPALLPRELRAYATALSFDAWAGSELFRKLIYPLFQNQIAAPVMRKQPGDAAAIDAALQHAAPSAFAHLESRLGAAFLVGDALSIADLSVVSNLLMFHYLGHHIDAARYPKLARYFRAQLDMPALASTLRDEKPIVQGMGLDTSVLS